MRSELDQRLCDRYPLIFRDRNADMRVTAMCWGFDHGDGWYDIIDQLCQGIQNHIDWSQECHDRDVTWNEQHAHEARPVTDVVPQVVATQIKEKFGTLRFYYTGGDDVIEGMVSMAEAMSSRVCETCGAPGSLRGRGWFYTACDQHARDPKYGADQPGTESGPVSH